MTIDKDVILDSARFVAAAVNTIGGVGTIDGKAEQGAAREIETSLPVVVATVIYDHEPAVGVEVAVVVHHTVDVSAGVASGVEIDEVLSDETVKARSSEDLLNVLSRVGSQVENLGKNIFGTFDLRQTSTAEERTFDKIVVEIFYKQIGSFQEIANRTSVVGAEKKVGQGVSGRIRILSCKSSVIRNRLNIKNLNRLQSFQLLSNRDERQEAEEESNHLTELRTSR